MTKYVYRIVKRNSVAFVTLTLQHVRGFRMTPVVHDEVAETRLINNQGHVEIVNTSCSIESAIRGGPLQDACCYVDSAETESIPTL